jgi:hypothetical protein
MIWYSDGAQSGAARERVARTGQTKRPPAASPRRRKPDSAERTRKARKSSALAILDEFT